MKESRTALQRTKTALIVVILILALAIASYTLLGFSSKPLKAVSAASTATFTSQINIGYVTELTGAGSSDGHAAMYGAELAVNQTNLAGGVDGMKIRLLVADSETNPTVASKQAESLDQKNSIFAFTGPTDSSDALSIRSYAESNGVPFVVAAAASAALATPGSNWTLRVEPDSVQRGVATAKYVSEASPNAKIALMTEDAVDENEMAAGVRWYANTFKNVSLVYDQSFTSSAFPWAAAATAVEASGADAVIIAWIPGAYSGENELIGALQSVGISSNQIFLVGAGADAATLGTTATGVRGITFFDASLAQGHPNASAFVSEMQPLISACAVCPRTLDNSYYFGYLGMEAVTNAIHSVVASGQPLTRAAFIASLKQSSVYDLFGNPISFDSNGASTGSYYVVLLQSLSSDQSGLTYYNLQILTTMTFAPNSIPVAQILKQG